MPEQQELAVAAHAMQNMSPVQHTLAVTHVAQLHAVTVATCAGFLHARQKAASHGNLASQDVEASDLPSDDNSVGFTAQHPHHERRHLLPHSVSALLSKHLS